MWKRYEIINLIYDAEVPYLEKHVFKEKSLLKLLYSWWPF